MKYRNSEIKVDALVSYINDNKINLNPAFQRGHVWTVKQRQGLIKNVLLGRPIPAVFLYKEADGNRYSYNILDGKQRIESLILFIANGHPDLKINNWAENFFGQVSKQGQFSVPLDGGTYKMTNLQPGLLRDFREYVIPTIEIELDESTSLDEVISLFIDINQQGEPVKRFDIVKALYTKKGFLRSVFSLVAQEQKRGQDVFYKMINNPFTAGLKNLQIVNRSQDANAKIDRMWERLLEIALFAERNTHAKPVEILKDFIRKDASLPKKLSAETTARLREVFERLKVINKSKKTVSVFTKEYNHLYILTTAMLSRRALMDDPDFNAKVASIGEMITQGKTTKTKLSVRLKEYLDLSSKQTTDPSKRQRRTTLFLEMFDQI